jgi:hypothetical protein
LPSKSTTAVFTAAVAAVAASGRLANESLLAGDDSLASGATGLAPKNEKGGGIKNPDAGVGASDGMCRAFAAGENVSSAAAPLFTVLMALAVLPSELFASAEAAGGSSAGAGVLVAPFFPGRAAIFPAGDFWASGASARFIAWSKWSPVEICPEEFSAGSA